MNRALLFISLMSLAACNQCPDITGRWHTPVNGMENMTQGFQLHPNGAAESINMATLVYKTWSRPDCDTLVMTGTSIGNGQTIEFTETYHVSMRDKNTMILTHENGYTQTYTRRQNQ